jgi:hypothetical protein
MVTFVNMGRLGNYLFECATAYAYALKHKQQFTTPHKTNNPFWDPIYFLHLIKAAPSYPRKPTHYIKERGHQYQELPFHPSWDGDNIILQGYFQSERYFKDYREEVLKAFNLPWNPHNNVSIHVRRGDYLQYPDKHPVVPESFYGSALIYFSSLGFTDFYVYSDDITYCKTFFAQLSPKLTPYKPNFIFHEGGTPIEDIVGISNCAGGHINSSSTFAWWGAWLNQNPSKIVITPKQWFMPGHGNLNTDDIIPESWIKM